MKNLNQALELMEQAIFSTLEEMGERSKELSIFCTVEEESAEMREAA